MKVVLLAVTSVNGKATRGSDPIIYSWTSKQEQKIFFEKIDQAQVIIMGAKTYEHARYLIKHKKGRTRVVITRNTKKYKDKQIPGVLEFTSDDPEMIVKKFEDRGVTKALLVGGSEINSLFLKQKLVSEVHISIEPLLFGTGKNILSDLDLNVELKLESMKTLNNSGTLYLVYKVL